MRSPPMLPDDRVAELEATGLHGAIQGIAGDGQVGERRVPLGLFGLVSTGYEGTDGAGPTTAWPICSQLV
jgi:hypothetical protein